MSTFHYNKRVPCIPFPVNLAMWRICRNSEIWGNVKQHLPEGMVLNLNPGSIESESLTGKLGSTLQNGEVVYSTDQCPLPTQ
jgi:hypothetical protein